MATFQTKADKKNGGIKAYAVTSVVKNGKRFRDWHYLGSFPTTREAEKEFRRVSENLGREKVRELNKSRITAKETPTLADTAPKYLKAEEGINLDSIQGMKRYQISLGHTVKALGTFKLHELTPEKIQEYVTNRKAEITYKGTHPSFKTIFNEVGQLSALCGWAMKQGYISIHPFRNSQYELKDYFGKGGKALRAETKAKVVLTDEEQVAILKSAENQPWAFSVVTILLYSAMRRSELSGLKLSDVNLTRKELMVRAEKTKDFRIIPLYGPLLALMPKLMRFRPTWRNWKPRNANTSEFLICEDKGVRVKSIGKDLFPPLIAKAGITKHVTNHVFRHTQISNLREAGFSSYEIMAITGHKNIKTLEGYGVNAPKGLGTRLEVAFPGSTLVAKKVDEKVEDLVTAIKTPMYRGIKMVEVVGIEPTS